MLKGRKSNEVIDINSNNSNNNIYSSFVKTNSFDLFKYEFEINNVRISARNILTKVSFNVAPSFHFIICIIIELFLLVVDSRLVVDYCLL